MPLRFEGDSQPSCNAELPRNVFEMCFHRSGRYAQPFSDPAICKALHEETRHVLLGRCQASPAFASTSMFLPGAASKPQGSHSGARPILIAPGSNPLVLRDGSLKQVKTICARACTSNCCRRFFASSRHVDCSSRGGVIVDRQ